MNRALCGRFELAYVTAVFALIDPAAGTLTYASAGHPSPIVVRKGPTLESLDERGMVLGFMPDVTYAATVHEFGAGERVVFYTDGITEASRPDGEFYGDRRFQATVLEGASTPAAGFTEALVADARCWAADSDFADDVTVVVVDVTDRVE
jgi:sigma-B regulation protein RsbU (phosphoserine phosphatase)